MQPLLDLDSDVRRPSGDTCPAVPAIVDMMAGLERELERERRFASDAAHELRTPIAGLRVQLEEARLHPEQTDPADLLDRALDSLERLETIVSDVLLFSTEPNRPRRRRRVDLAKLARDEVSRRIDRTAVMLRTRPGVLVDADSAQLGRVLTNLLDNAQRHAEQVVRVGVSRDGDSAVLAVEDDGDGVAEADRERIFAPFTRLDAAHRYDHRLGRRGTGLGLAICRDIAKAHLGTLGVEDTSMGGACFVLRLPLAPPSRVGRPRRATELAG